MFTKKPYLYRKATPIIALSTSVTEKKKENENVSLEKVAGMNFD